MGVEHHALTVALGVPHRESVSVVGIREVLLRRLLFHLPLLVSLLALTPSFFKAAPLTLPLPRATRYPSLFLLHLSRRPSDSFPPASSRRPPSLAVSRGFISPSAVLDEVTIPRQHGTTIGCLLPLRFLSMFSPWKIKSPKTYGVKSGERVLYKYISKLSANRGIIDSRKRQKTVCLSARGTSNTIVIRGCGDQNLTATATLGGISVAALTRHTVHPPTSRARARPLPRACARACRRRL